ncbi:uncharacterized protein HKW66_Vig0107160 [Vigna angularis]|uniref:Uncharacterized protein n=2 Tax=Phaseolus angularis TaxID=3914 RepID=A0A8T0KVP6_PHAAN|nr:uncharacterized protein LOC128195481 [Vigna angularis]KAG2403796.1 uncharacterized protein HKW66_Vig0107160 [Vigna angularis]BAT83020.1 hypothetical protein VIGAN_04011500 [Vigna angularis var. angularis]
MAASLSSFFFVQPRRPYPKRSNTRLIKVQNYQDEERWTSVDGDLNVLKKRIEMVRVKERLERCCRSQHGWNYVPLYNDKIRGNKEFNVIEFVGLVCGSLGLTCFAGTLFICLLSLLLHLQLFFFPHHL